MESDTGIDDSRPERRRWPRTTWNPKLLLWAGDVFCQDAEVVDESAGGVALLVKDGTVFQSSQEVRLTHGDRSAPGIVKYVHQRKDGKYQLGLEWGPSEGTSESSVLSLLSHR